MAAKLNIKRVSPQDFEPGFADSLTALIESWGGTVFHEPLFNGIASGAYGSKLTYFLAYRGASLVGCCACHSFPQSLLTNSFAYPPSAEIPYGGWVFDTTQVSIGELVSQTPVRFFEALHFASNIELVPGQQSEIGNLHRTEQKTILIALADKSADKLFDSMDKKQRNKIRRAEKLGVEVQFLKPTEFKIFAALSEQLKLRTGLLGRKETFIAGVFDNYYALGKAACIAAKYEGEYISSMILLANKQYTIAWVAGRVSDLPNNLYQNELLIWESVKCAYGNCSKYFDLCGLDEERFPHLARLKRSFSDDVRNFYAYSKVSKSFRVLRRLRRAKGSRK